MPTPKEVISSIKKDYIDLLDGYKVQNPVKYEHKKVVLGAKIESIKYPDYKKSHKEEYSKKYWKLVSKKNELK